MHYNMSLFLDLLLFTDIFNNNWTNKQDKISLDLKKSWTTKKNMLNKKKELKLIKKEEKNMYKNHKTY
jgi:Mn-dependent DtxR family transcriptional regulator